MFYRKYVLLLLKKGKNQKEKNTQRIFKNTKNKNKKIKIQ